MSPGLPIAMSEPMEDAWSELLKEEEPTVHPGYPKNMSIQDLVNMGIDYPFNTERFPQYESLKDEHITEYGKTPFNPHEPEHDEMAQYSLEYNNFKPDGYLPSPLQMREQVIVPDKSPSKRDIDSYLDMPDETGAARVQSFAGTPFNEKTNFTMSEPMEDAWSEILKRDTAKTIAARRRRESRQQFRPSTGQFKTPPGGMSGGVGATKRRHAARMRGISSGKKTGLMKPHLSVEMSHRGIATKQPMSKDPQKYTAYRGQSEARKIQGNVRTPFSPRGRYGQRSFTAGPTGAGRLSGLLAGQRGQMSQPALRQLGVRRPRIRRPRAPPMPRMPQMPMGQSSVPNMPASPSSIMMSEDAQVYSDLLKAKNIVQRFELLNLMRRLIAAKEKEAKIKKYVQGGGSAFEDGHVPDHPAGVHQHEDEEEKNDGPTQNLETNSSRLGLDPAGALISRRGHMG
jgi:hypothetical protein